MFISNLQANALRSQLQQIVDSYVNANDAIEYVNDDNEPAYDSIDMDALGMWQKEKPFIIFFCYSSLATFAIRK